MFIYSMVLQCAVSLNPGLNLDQSQQILQPCTVIHSYTVVINHINPVHSLQIDLPPKKILKNVKIKFCFYKMKNVLLSFLSLYYY